MSDTEPPVFDLTVTTIGLTAAGDCRVAVESLARQTIADRLEVIVLSPDSSGIDPELQARFGAYRYVETVIDAAGTAMARGVREARAPYVAYAEEHQTAAEDWAERLVEAHAMGHDLVGFAMGNGNPDTAVSWAHMYGQFGPVVEPVESGPRAHVGGHHVSYSRDLLLAYGDDLDAIMEDENVLFVQLRDQGRPIYLEGGAVVYHVNISRLGGLLALDYWGQRSFGAGRARLGGWSIWKRLIWAAACPLVPFVRLRRSLADVRRTGRMALLPRIVPLMLLAFAAGAAGEAMGYVFGEGDAAMSKVPAELRRSDFTVEGVATDL